MNFQLFSKNIANFKDIQIVIKIFEWRSVVMSVLNCRYYGFECNYELEGSIEKITDKFKNHIVKEHGIDYTKEFLTQVILRKRQ